MENENFLYAALPRRTTENSSIGPARGIAFFQRSRKQLGAVPSPYMFQALSFGVKLESIHTLLSLIKKAPPLTQHDHVFSISDGTYMIFFIVYASTYPGFIWRISIAFDQE